MRWIILISKEFFISSTSIFSSGDFFPIIYKNFKVYFPKGEKNPLHFYVPSQLSYLTIVFTCLLFILFHLLYHWNIFMKISNKFLILLTNLSPNNCFFLWFYNIWFFLYFWYISYVFFSDFFLLHQPMRRQWLLPVWSPPNRLPLFCPSNLLLISTNSTVLHPTGPDFNLNSILDPSSPPFQTNNLPALPILSLNCTSNVSLLFHFHSDSLKDIIKLSSYQLQKSSLMSYLPLASFLIYLHWVGYF